MACVSHHTLWQQVSIIHASSWLQVWLPPQESMLGSGSQSKQSVSHTYASSEPCLPAGNAWYLNKELRQCQSAQPHKNHCSCFAESRCSEMRRLPLHHRPASPLETALAMSGKHYWWFRGRPDGGSQSQYLADEVTLRHTVGSHRDNFQDEKTLWISEGAPCWEAWFTLTAADATSWIKGDSVVLLEHNCWIWAKGWKIDGNQHNLATFLRAFS